jgi:hypothetical protein
MDSEACDELRSYYNFALQKLQLEIRMAASAQQKSRGEISDAIEGALSLTMG